MQRLSMAQYVRRNGPRLKKSNISPGAALPRLDITMKVENSLMLSEAVFVSRFKPKVLIKRAAHKIWIRLPGLESPILSAVANLSNQKGPRL